MNANPRIIAAFLAGFLILGAAFWLRRPPAAPVIATMASNTQGPVPIRGFIPVNDADHDGLPDWQNTVGLATIKIDEAPVATTTETGLLAAEIANRTYLNGSSAGVTLSGLSANLVKQSVDRDYTVADIRVSEDNSLEAKRAYGNKVAAIAFQYAVPDGTDNELTILNSALLREDPAILQKLDPIISSYEQMLNAMVATPVPSSLTREHLVLINVYQAILNDIKAFRTLFDDALPAMARFRRYQADVEALYAAISLLYTGLHEEGIQWNESDPAGKFVIIK